MNRRLYSPVGEGTHVPNPTMLLLARILLIAAMALLILVAIGTRLLGTLQPVHFWAVVVLYTLPIALLLGALACRLQYSVTSMWPRRILVWLVVFLIMLAATLAYSFIGVYGQFGMTAVSYYTHAPSGHRLVVMKGADPDSVSEADSGAAPTYDYIYGVYPMSGRFFFRPLLGGEVTSNTGVDYVQWSDDGNQADVTIFDLDGEEQHILIDYNADEQAILDAMNEAEEAQKAAEEPSE